MAGIRSWNIALERAVHRFLLHYRKLPGRPDIVLSGGRVVTYEYLARCEEGRGDFCSWTAGNGIMVIESEEGRRR